MRPDERGAGTLMVAAVCLALVAVVTGALVLVGWLGAATRAGGAADLTALAAAEAVAQGQDGCAIATRTAEANEADLETCQVFGEPRSFVVEVSIRVPLGAGLGRTGLAVTRTATAGTG
ncbi:hypothetical protein EII34_07790 [Arachnia propionica]|uniref:Helicase/secretion neighborhood TadE-like protein n=1 Tax=Arachnia propionica TaxID=1750 RepID=A0A3P1T7R4_9ACTN|nr:Rv3654c family TadE-like protein [Arachnia propionica]MDO5083979.1 hypothetical protein [Arachnia propionica]RRD05225.1 hypothetical protein EII34_07790 [Arachnia propionica]